MKHTKLEIDEAKADLRAFMNPRYMHAHPQPDAKGKRRFFVTMESGEQRVIYESEARDYLPTLYFVIASVSRSGMSRTMRVYVDRDGLVPVHGLISRVTGLTLTRDGVRIGGCGMDMTFALLDSVCGAVFGNGPGVLNANHFQREVL